VSETLKESWGHEENEESMVSDNYFDLVMLTNCNENEKKRFA